LANRGIWAATLIILYGGVKKGVELPIRFLCLYCSFYSQFGGSGFAFTGRSTRTECIFTPNWAAMMDYKVWLAAYGHTFSLCRLALGSW
jgi:NSS family neurotransmitter:Na+ symporter